MDNNDFTVIVHTLFFHLSSFGLEYHLSLYDNKKQNQDLARLSLGILTCDAFKSELLMPMEVCMGESVYDMDLQAALSTHYSFWWVYI